MEQYKKLVSAQYYIDTSLKTIDEYTLWLKKRRKKNGDKLIDSSIERYVYYIKRFEKIFINPQLSTTALDKLIQELGGSIIYSVVLSWLQYCGYDVKTDKAFFVLIRRMTKTASAISSKRFLQSKVQSVVELKALIDAEKYMLYKLLYLFSYDTACRRHEVFGVKWKHIQFFGEPTDNIYAQVQILGKGKKQRQVYLHKYTAEMLQQYRDAMISRGEKVTDESHVFRIMQKREPDKAYKNQAHEYYKHLVKHARAILGKSVHPHCFRHTKLTHMADSSDTPDPFGIMMYAGHEDISTAMIYIELSPVRAKHAFIKSSKSLYE